MIEHLATRRAAPKTRMNCEEFERFAAELDWPCELIDGEVEILAPGGYEHSSVSINLTIILGSYIKRKRLGHVLGNEAGIHIQQDPARSRGMDLAYISYDRLPRGARLKGFLNATPELIVEVLGEDWRKKRIKSKIRDYHKKGVDMVWVADPEARTVTKYPRGKKPEIVHDGELLDGGEILPGFSVPMAEIFDEG